MSKIKFAVARGPAAGSLARNRRRAFYILEFNPTTEQSRVLRVGP